jgi:hypothetical protein
MPTIKLHFDENKDTVWFWELCKKLGYKVLEVDFCDTRPVVVNLAGDLVAEPCIKCAGSIFTNRFGQPKTAQEIEEVREGIERGFKERQHRKR